MKYYLIGYLLSFVVMVGWQNAYSKGKHPTVYDYREEMGFAIVWCAFVSLIWPLFLPAFYCITGFAKHGWSVRP